MQWAICWSGNSYLHLLRQKSNCSRHIVTPIIYVLFGVVHSKTLLENLLSVIVTVYTLAYFIHFLGFIVCNSYGSLNLI